MSYRSRIYEKYDDWRSSRMGAYTGLKGQLARFFPDSIFPELRFFHQIPRESRILELGCGGGHFLDELYFNGFQNCLGVDILRPDRNMPNEFFESDIIEFLKNTNESFQVIYMFDVLEHFHKDEIFEILELVRLRLADDGRFIVRVPNASSVVGRFNQFADFSHETPFNEESLYQVLMSVGFQKIQILGIERWIKVWLDPRRWPGALLFSMTWARNRLISTAFGGPKILSANLIGESFKV